MTWARTRRRAGAGNTEPRSRASTAGLRLVQPGLRAHLTHSCSPSMLCCKRNEAYAGVSTDIAECVQLPRVGCMRVLVMSSAMKYYMMRVTE